MSSKDPNSPSSESREALAFWQRRLAHAAAGQLELPADRRRQQREHGRRQEELCRVSLPDGVVPGLRTIDSDLSGIVLASFFAWLHRLTGQQDLTVAWLEHDRLLPLRVRLEAGTEGREPSLAVLRQRVAQTREEAQRHALDWNALVSELRPKIDRPDADHDDPFTEVMLSVKPGDVAAEVPTKQLPVQHDLAVEVVCGQDSGTLHARYDSELFDASTIENLMASFAACLHAVTQLSALQASTVRELEMVSEAQWQQMERWNREARTEAPLDASLPELFLRAVQEYPDRPALTYGDVSLTYRQLEARAQNLAQRLLALDVRPGDLVAVCLERSHEQITCFVAVALAGAAYVPLDPAYPLERLVWMIEDSATKVLLTDTEQAARLPIDALTSRGCDIVRVDEGLLTRTPADETRRPLPQVDSDYPAYVIYTSGSTGQPKGVVTPQSGVIRLVFGSRFYDFCADDRIAQASNTSFDAATLEIWGALLHGGHLLGIDRETLLSAERLRARLAELHPTLMWLTASLFHQYARQVPDLVAPVGTLIFGGERCDPDAVRTSMAHGSTTHINGYGPTETTTFTACYRVPSVPPGANSVPIGRPIGNTEVWVLDRWQRPLPVATAGELVVAGPGLAMGYHRRPGKTASVFIPHPCPHRSGDRRGGTRVYRTGDLVRWLPSGVLDYIGRIDNQVKLRGFRVELGEIEAKLGQHPAIRERVVVMQDDGQGSKRLVAYVVVAAEVAPPSVQDLRTFLGRSLPEYLVPTGFQFLDELPLNANGKVDRRALPAFDFAHAGLDLDTFVAPRTDTERQVAELWTEVLGAEQIGVETSFFALGGHSLLATRLLARIRDLLGLELSLHEIFEHPTIAALAQRIDEERASGGAGVASLPPIPQVDPTRPAPLSFGQRRLWFLHQLELSSALYNIPSAFELQGELEVEALDRSLADIARRHAVLRTRYGSREGEPVALVDAPRRWHLEIVDLRSVGQKERQRRAAALVQQAAQAPFDLELDAPWRTHLLRLEDDHHVLLLNIHHIATDGWSQDLIAKEMSRLYSAFRRGEASPLGEPALQYADFAAWQASWLEEAEQQRLVQYWRQRLEGLEPADLPADRPRPSVQQAEGALFVMTLPAALSERVHGLARQHGETLFTVLLAAFYAVFARYSGRHDLAVGTPSAGRYRTEFESLVGLFANTLVLRLDLTAGEGEDPNRTFDQLLRSTRQTVVGAQIHQALPFERLVQELEPTRDAARTPFFQVLFQVLAMELAPSLEGLEQRPLTGHSATAKFDVEVTIFDRPEGLRVSVEYATALFDATTIERLFESYRLLLEGVLDQPTLPLWRVPIVPAADRQLIDLINRTDRAFLPDDPNSTEATLHAMVARQAARTPEHPALLFEAAADPGQSRLQALSYAELWRRVEVLAARLRRLGVTPEEPVGVCLPRHPELVVALLAVLEAGGSYLPLDPAYPPQRLAFMLADTGARRVVTHGSLAHLFEDHGDSGTQLLCLDEPMPQLEGSEVPPPTPVDPQQRAYLIYTSGSTGSPKGVEITHRNAAAMLAWAARIFSSDELAGVAAVTSVCFDLSVYELFLPLTQGGTVVLARDALHLLEHPARQRITLLNTVPSAATELAAAGGIPTSVRVINLAGEPLRRTVVDAVYAASTATKVYNLYGPSEDTTYSTWKLVEAGLDSEPTVGAPLHNTRAHVLDRHGEAVPIGVTGELYLAGEGVSRSYLRRPAITADRYSPDPFGHAGTRLYRTGDRARWRSDGELEILGRLDHQVKLHGYRIELGEIEATLLRHPAVRDAAVLVRGPRLVAYVAMKPGPAAGVDGRATDEVATDEELRDFAATRLAPYMVPALFERLPELPQTPNGKIDRKALAARSLPEEQHEVGAGAPPVDEAESFVAELWRQVLDLGSVAVDKNFFDLGGHSLLLPRLHLRLKERWPRVRMLDLLQHTTVRQLASFLRTTEPQLAAASPVSPAALERSDSAVLRHHVASTDIAIIAVAGRFPQAPDIDTLWHNVVHGVEAIQRFDREQLLRAGEDPARLEDPDYVPAGTEIDHVRDFDADFFCFSVREAALTDPQQRLLLECAWEALERAGWAGDTFAGDVGVFAGTGAPGYLVKNLLTRPELLHQQGEVQAMIATGADFTATRVAYKLGLRGPAVSVQTACSTSLVAVHMACQSLLTGDCDMALAGGCTLQIPHGVGYLHVADSVASPDGHCRAFDAAAGGTVESSGAGFVVLKRLADAQADGDPIVALIKGTAINNDGAAKIGYTAPSVDGQARVIARALRRAEVAPSSLGYVECHGTGTVLGDPIEVDALRRAYSQVTSDLELAGETGGEHRGLTPQSIALSSFKTQVGHMDTAAGVGSLIRAALALQHATIPPNLHFETANPELDLEHSPFSVTAEAQPWPAHQDIRRAAVSAFGIGGTNAHAVLEQAPARDTGERPSRPVQLLRLSARTPEALETSAADLARHLGVSFQADRQEETSPRLDLADVAFTLHRGRKAFEHRLITTVDTGDPAQAVQQLRGLIPRTRHVAQAPSSPPSMVFLFPGQGTQHAGMARQLYASEEVFRRQFDEGCDFLQPVLDLDLRDLVLVNPQSPAGEEAQRRLASVDVGQPALFLVEYALARQWMSWGIEPRAMLGHSLGELVAATLAGVFERDTALRLVSARGRLMSSLPTGAMLAISQPAAEVEALVQQCGWTDRISLATINSPADCVVAGEVAAIDAFEARLAAGDIETRRLHLTTAAHSLLMEPILDAYRAEVERAAPQRPNRPFVSCVTGQWVEPQEAASVDYWTRHLRQTVRFGDAVERLFELHHSEPGGIVFLEVGPGHSLSTLVRRNEPADAQHPVVRSLPHPRDDDGDLNRVIEAIGRLWLHGIEIDADAFWDDETRRRVVLPTYPFDRRRCWIEPDRSRRSSADTRAADTTVEESFEATTTETPLPMREHQDDLPSGTRAAVAAAWRELLGLERVDPDVEFLEVGGHSLLATQLAHLLRRRFGVEVRATEILGKAATVAEQAALIDARRPVSTDELQPVPRSDPLPLSDSQERLWLLSRLDHDTPTDGSAISGSAAYNLPVVMRLQDRLHVRALHRALADLARRHEVLRTAVVQPRTSLEAVSTQRPVQQIETGEDFEAQIDLPVVDVSRLNDVEGWVRQQALRDVARPMDLARAPLWRAHLYLAQESPSTGDEPVCYLALTMHHSILDGWSGRILFRDLGAFYRDRLAQLDHDPTATKADGTSNRAAAALPELPVQYADYAAWQRHLLDQIQAPHQAPHQAGRQPSSMLAEQVDYWRQQLTGAPPLLELPLDHPRPTTQSFRGRRLTFEVPAEVTRGLRDVAREAQATMFPVLLAAFQVLLARWSGQWDISVGTPVANREEPRTQELIGFFVNTLVLRTVIDPTDAFAALVRQVKTVVAGGFAHQELPFERLISELRPAREAGVNPLFQVMMVFHNTPPWGHDFAGIPFDLLEADSEISHFDLTLSLEERGAHTAGGDGLAGLIDFSTDLFETDTVQRLIDGLQALLAAVASPTLPASVAALPVMSEAHERQVVHAWNATSIDWSRHFDKVSPGDSLHDLVLRQSRWQPHAIAVEAADGCLSYGALISRARALSSVLRQTGVTPGDLVALSLQPSCDAMVSILAIHLAGGAYLPLDIGAPEERRCRILEDTGCGVLISSTPLEGFPGTLVPPQPPVDASTDPGPAERLSPTYPAYVITTSGSTGRPKGVVVDHRSAVNLARAFVHHHDLRPEHRFLALPPLHFDASVGDLFPTWAAGGCLIFHPDPARLNGARLDQFCTRHRVSVIDTAVALWKVWLEEWQARGPAGSDGDSSRSVLPDLEVMMVGGEAVDTQRLASWARMSPPRARIFNHYGPTEATVCATSYPSRDGSEVTRRALPIGAPLPNVRAYVLSSALFPQPASVAGELCLGGTGIALGYLRQPALTAEVFVPDPFASLGTSSKSGGDRLYRTGDLARWLSPTETGGAGLLEFLGRRDRQVKIRGFRIELGEIEATLQAHPDVVEAVVVANGTGAATQLVAYAVVPGSTSQPRESDAETVEPQTTTAIRAFLTDRLPAYMLPSAIVALPELPLTPNGKVDLRALPAPLSTLHADTPVEPRTALEGQLLEIWRHLLEVPELGVEDDFFAAGGSSLLAMQLTNRMQQALELELPLTQLFEATTVAAFARVVEALRQGEQERLDLRSRAALDPTIQPVLGRSHGEGILVTGGTGFLGAYLVDELLQARKGDIYILVRADDLEAGHARIRRNLESYDLWTAIEQRGDGDRLVPILGDLSQPRLGLAPDAFGQLASQLGELHHNAAAVDFVRPYSALEAINVRGTEEVLRLASHEGARPVLFVSTLGLFLQPAYENITVTEDDAPDPGGLAKGYEQSKWVAEQLCEQARRRGLPVHILRPARVSGAASTGAANTQDLFYSWIKGCIQMGMAPDIDHAIDLMPVDYLAQAIVQLASELTPAEASAAGEPPTEVGRAFHFYNTHTLPFHDLARWIDQHVRPLQLVPYDQWVRELRAIGKKASRDVAAPREEVNALLPFLALFGDTLDHDQQPIFDQSHSQAHLRAAGLHCPKVDGDLLRSYFDYLERSAFLPQQESASTPTGTSPTKRPTSRATTNGGSEHDTSTSA